MQRRPPDISDYIQIFLRRKWWIILPTLAVVCLMCVISVNLPRYYKSSTVIGIDAQKVPTEFVRNTINSDAVQRLQAISQEILSRTRLQKIIEQYGLYKDKTNLSQEDVIELMRKDIALDVVEDKNNTNSTTHSLGGFKITYTSTNPQMAQQVTRQLGSLFIEENLKLRQSQAEGTSEFISQELEKAKLDLETQETRIKEFKARYMGSLPEQQAANLQMIGQAQAMLQANSDALSRAQQQKTYLESMENSLEKQKPAPAKTELQTALIGKRAELTVAKEKYQPNHPDLIRLQNEVAALEQQAKDLAKTEQPNDPKAGSADQMKSQIAMANDEIKARQQKQTELENRIRTLQNKVDVLPVIEQQYAEFNRDYTVASDNYKTLLAKKNASGMSADVEHQAQGEQFRVIDPASLPQKPYKPDLIQLNLIGMFGGLVIGCGLGAMKEFKDSAMYSEKDIRYYLPMPHLGTMPVVMNSESKSELRKLRMRTMMMSAATVVLVIGLAAYIYTHRVAFDIATTN
jgi:polysaccharide chain length determinant protein (PEP-CTERM system associated)